MGHSPGFGAPHFTIKAQWQPWRVESRLQDKISNISALKYFLRLSLLFNESSYCHVSLRLIVWWRLRNMNKIMVEINNLRSAFMGQGLVCHLKSVPDFLLKPLTHVYPCHGAFETISLMSVSHLASLTSYTAWRQRLMDASQTECWLNEYTLGMNNHSLHSVFWISCTAQAQHVCLTSSGRRYGWLQLVCCWLSCLLKQPWVIFCSCKVLMIDTHFLHWHGIYNIACSMIYSTWQCFNWYRMQSYDRELKPCIIHWRAKLQKPDQCTRNSSGRFRM